MNRSRRAPLNKQFVSGGVYDARQSFGGNQHGNQGNQRNQRNQGGGYQNYRNKVNQQDEEQQNYNGNNDVQPQQQQQQQQIETQPKQTAPLEPPPQPPHIDDEQPLNEEEHVEENVDEENVEDNTLYDESGKLQYKNIFRTRKKSSVRAKEKKLRQNRQLRKTLIPKNALMALHEVTGITISEFTVESSAGGGFVAVVTVNDKQYEGKGNSKMAAKNSASEKALRDYVLEKMREKPRLRKNSTNAEEAMDTNEDNNCENGGNGEQEDSTASATIDDVPMANLASFAIYKLFLEWENEGYIVPELRVAHTTNTNSAGDAASIDSSPQVKPPKAPPVRTELPNNWESIHPSTLLCMMRPGLQYRELGTVGERPCVLQRMSATVDDVEYVSSGRSKKIARRNVAVSVLNELFGTNFTKEGPCED